MAIEIETSTDTPEQVQRALANNNVQVDESPASEEKPAKETPAEEPTEEAAEETPVEGEEGTEEAEEKPAKPAKPATHPDMVPRSRLNEEIRKRREAEHRLAESGPVKPGTEEEESEEPKLGSPQRPYCGRLKPTIDQFTSEPDKYSDPHAAFAEAVGEWIADEREAKRELEKRVEEYNRVQQERTAPFREAMPETLERHPDYKAVVDGSDLVISERMETFVYESKVGPDLLYLLVTEPKEAQRIRGLVSHRAQDKAMEELEARILAEIAEGSEETEEEGKEKPAAKPQGGPPKKPVTAPAKPKVSKAPAPPEPIKSLGKQPRSERELAGPEDRTGVDIEYSPDYSKAVEARRKAK